MFPVLRPILNRGGAGYSISREETVTRLRPYVESGLELLKTYSTILPGLTDREAAARLEGLMPFFRTELGKLYETIFSVGGTASTGTDVDFTGTGGDGSRGLDTLVERERAFAKSVGDEVDSVHHQERTRAILKSVAAGSQGRLDVLRELVSRRPAPRS